MDAVLDTIWEYLASGFIFLGETTFGMLNHIHFLGPVFLVSLLAFCTICVTKVLNKVIITKRFLKLEKNFNYWLSIREEATKHEDRVKGQRMARNIDQAELNRVYYDYFFEGLLLGIARRIIPIFFVFAFINEFYRPERMLEMFGHKYVIKISAFSTDPVLIGAVFWYFLSLLLGYILWAITGRIIKKMKNAPVQLATPAAENNCPAPQVS
jgi:hypothetical protein